MRRRREYGARPKQWLRCWMRAATYQDRLRVEVLKPDRLSLLIEGDEE
jgi:hypothetical protein